MQRIVREALTSVLQGADGNPSDAIAKSRSNGGLSGIKGVAAGAGAAALTPVAIKTAGKLARGLGVDSVQGLVKSPGEALGGATSKLGDRVTASVKDRARGAVEEAGGPGGIAKDALKGMLPFGGPSGGSNDDGNTSGGSKGSVPGVGKGRRVPVQQSIDIGLPIETVYNQWTQFEEWPNFMHRVTRVTQEDDCTVSFATKIWGKTKEFKANIETQRPEKRIKWRVSEGMTHTGIVTFHELGPELTRVLLGFDVDPGSLIEKFARGARHVKRAARADMHRFKAFIEMAEQETGAWRGVIEEGELVEEHDPSYDKQRDYSDIEEVTGQQESDADDEQSDEDDQQSGEEDRDKDRQERRRPKSGTAKRSEPGQRSRRTRRRGRDNSQREDSEQPARRRSSSGQARARASSSRSGSGRGSGGTGSSRRSSGRSGSASGGSRTSSSGRSSGGRTSRSKSGS